MEQDLSKLTKKERKEIRKQEHVDEFAKEKRMKLLRNCLIAALLVLLLGGVGWWVYKESNKPVPGDFVKDLGRDHVPQSEWSKYKYNSNPPTSGPHDLVWIKKGVYDTPQGDGYLVHSLEHGYIIISYNCEKIKISQGWIAKAYAHEEGDTLTIEEHATESAKLEGDSWKSKACEDLKKQLKEVAEENKIWKLIVVPRPQLDVPIALTSWTRIQKLNVFDKQKIRDFTNAYRDRGPEQTMEP